MADAEQHAPIPRESDPASLRAYLLSFDWPGEGAGPPYMLVGCGLPTWLEVVRLVPEHPTGGRLLELGSPPFCITLLLKKLRRYDLTPTAGLVDGRAIFRDRRVSATYGEAHDFECVCLDLERDPFPFPDDTFDVVVWSEVIEHLTENPVATLAEIHRVLRPGGALVVSTPNVARTDNLLRLLFGHRNIYDPYHLGSSFRGSRHSREYTLSELTALIGGCGFRIDHAAARTVVPRQGLRWRDAALRGVALGLLAGIRLTQRLLGTPPGAHDDHLFVRARKEGPFRWHFPADVFDPGHLAWYRQVRDPEVVMGENDVPHLGPGWGPLETGIDGRPQRRAPTGASAWLLTRDVCRAVTLDVTATPAGDGLTVEVWRSDGEHLRRLGVEHGRPAAGAWSRLTVPFEAPVDAGAVLLVRLLCPAGVCVHRLATRKD